MIIIPRRLGQLGNQLFHMAHFAATAMQFDLEVKFPCFQYPLIHFPHINSFHGFSVRQTSARLNKFQSRVFKVLQITRKLNPLIRVYVNHEPPHFNLADSEFVRSARGQLVLCDGFAFRDIENIKRFYPEIIHLFSFSPTIKGEADHFLSQLPLTDEFLVFGFHIRRGDYQWYENGKFFFTDGQWIHWIEQSREMAKAMNRKFMGILFSNEGIDPILRSGSDLRMGPGGIYTDLETMARCHYIMGPQSTYSGWASFIGKVPLLQLTSDLSQFQANHFKVVEW